ncbi:hypothetical protein BCR43DRAFT_540970, partial [Syncephalastrum racemosum]
MNVISYQRLVREVALMEILDHQNVVHLYETYEAADSLYLIMEYVPRSKLNEYLQHRVDYMEMRPSFYFVKSWLSSTTATG